MKLVAYCFKCKKFEDIVELNYNAVLRAMDTA